MNELLDFFEWVASLSGLWFRLGDQTNNVCALAL
jgi:hypothetical protein